MLKNRPVSAFLQLNKRAIPFLEVLLICVLSKIGSKRAKKSPKIRARNSSPAQRTA